MIYEILVAKNLSAIAGGEGVATNQRDPGQHQIGSDE